MGQSQRAGKTDGQLFRAEEADLEPGSVLRMAGADGSAAPFSDFVVLASYWVGSDGKRKPAGMEAADRREVLMARPFLYATHAGTTCPSHLTGVEEIRVDADSVLKPESLFRVVCTARGNLHQYVK